MPVTVSRKRGLLALSALAAAWVGACGARSGVEIPPPADTSVPGCMADDECPGFGDLCAPVACLPDPPLGPGQGSIAGGGKCTTLPIVDCDDNDPCTTELCEAATGACSYAPSTLDTDGDGHRAPLPGTLPGAPFACGDDCDDTSPLAFPGGVEACDGTDNDCNGVVDDNAAFVPLGAAVRISGDIAPSGAGGLAYNGTSYAAAYTGTSGGFHMYLSMLDPTGQKLTPGDTPIALDNGDSSGGPIVWTGDRFGVAWQDRRTGDYETYISFLDPAGQKKFPDTRLSYAGGFSVNISLAWNGAEFIAVWQDNQGDGIFNLVAQRVAVQGPSLVLVGSAIALTDDIGGFGNESPSVAVGTQGIGVSWASGDAFTHFVQFQTFTPTLEPMSKPVVITDGSTEAVYPTAVWNKDRYVITWFDRTASPKGIYAATVAEDGTVLVPPKAITQPGAFRSRFPFMRPLGDRVLFVYADDRDQNDGYEIYARMVDANLDPLGGESRLTNAPKDSVGPIVASGPDGSVGILFRDDREGGAHHVYFTQLACVAGN